MVLKVRGLIDIGLDDWAMDSVLVRFGRRVRELRKAKGMSQEALALEAGLDRSYIGGVERGERNVSLENIHRLARTLSISVAELMRGV
jgi:transcriptional regulator with XRE-family HTH domain